jgi:hypothetical protein
MSSDVPSHWGRSDTGGGTGRLQSAVPGTGHCCNYRSGNDRSDQDGASPLHEQSSQIGVPAFALKANFFPVFGQNAAGTVFPRNPRD